MNIENKYPVMIFKNVNEGKTFYSLGLSKKDADGNYVNGYISCRFKKDVELEDKTKIYIKNAFLTFYVKDKITVPYIFISEFDTVDQTIEKIKKENEVQEDVVDPYSTFGSTITVEQLDEMPDLPF